MVEKKPRERTTILKPAAVVSEYAKPGSEPWLALDSLSSAIKPNSSLSHRFLLGFTLIWASTPRWFHFALSRLVRWLCEWRISRFYLPIYCRFEYPKTYRLDRFIPASGASSYASFQDFFMRKLKYAVILGDALLWPCDGIVCEIDRIEDMRLVSIKGQTTDIRKVFSDGSIAISKDYFFVNIFLHNRDYHRIHAPVSGLVTRIEKIPGVLLVLRPWAYELNPSLPALTNERINIDITSAEGEIWYLSIVGGPGVSTIHLAENVQIGKNFCAGEELAAFAIGSTCCMAVPKSILAKPGLIVEVGQRILA